MASDFDNSNQIIVNKLDKVIELLERLPDKDEDIFLAKSDLLRHLIDEAKSNSPSSDWKQELDEL